MDLSATFLLFESQKSRDPVENVWVHDAPEGSMASVALKNRMFPQLVTYQNEYINSERFFFRMESVITPKKQNHPAFKPKVNLDDMARVLSRVNILIQHIADVLSTQIKARIVISKTGGHPFLLTYLHGFPIHIFGGYSKIPAKSVEKPPILNIFEAWRGQFWRSFRRVIPSPLFQKMCKNVDGDEELDWSVHFIRSADFGEIVYRVMDILKELNYNGAVSLNLENFNNRHPEILNEKNRVYKLIEEESRAFWTYEKIGKYLRM